MVLLEVITQVNLLPLDDDTVDQKLASFKNYNDEVTTILASYYRIAGNFLETYHSQTLQNKFLETERHL